MPEPHYGSILEPINFFYIFFRLVSEVLKSWKKLRRCIFLCRIRSYFFRFFQSNYFAEKNYLWKNQFFRWCGGGGSWKYRESHHFACLNTCQNFSEFQEGCLFHYYNRGYPLIWQSCQDIYNVLFKRKKKKYFEKVIKIHLYVFACQSWTCCLRIYIYLHQRVRNNSFCQYGVKLNFTHRVLRDHEFAKISPEWRTIYFIIV